MMSGTPRVSGTDGSRLMGTARRSLSITTKQSAAVVTSQAVRTASSMSGSPHSALACGTAGNRVGCRIDQRPHLLQAVALPAAGAACGQQIAVDLDHVVCA